MMNPEPLCSSVTSLLVNRTMHPGSDVDGAELLHAVPISAQLCSLNVFSYPAFIHPTPKYNLFSCTEARVKSLQEHFECVISVGMGNFKVCTL